MSREPKTAAMSPMSDPEITVETARRAFGNALSSRVSMNIRLGDVPVQVLREAMAEALAAASGLGVKNEQ
jgi:hypothetical protein